MKNKACCWILIAGGLLFVLFFVGTGIILSTALMKGGTKLAVKDNSYLLLELSGLIPEYRAVPQIEWLFRDRPPTLHDMLRALNKAADDPRIAGVILRPSGIAGFAEIRELRGAIHAFRQSHKPVYAYLEIATDRDYYLASAADTIIVSPAHSGGLAMLGLSINSTYLARTFEKIGIKFNVLHVGDYKGAYENLAVDSMSQPLRESLQWLLDDLFSTYTREIADSRSALSEDTLEHELLRGRSFLIDGAAAVAKGLADYAMDWGDFRERLLHENELHTVNPGRYGRAVGPDVFAKKEIAVVYAAGEIGYGRADGSPFAMQDAIQSDDLVRQLRDLRTDSSVAAVVLRVNSPGGSALASEIIYREMLRLKAVKPVVVSMGNVAASGGYYISCAADHIVAQPNTITGSIGVVSVFPSAEGLYAKIGARVQTVEKGKWAEFFRLDQKLRADQKAVLMEFMTGVYNEFVSHVAAGRGLSSEEVEAVAAGRVWTGTQAEACGLVDELGGLEQAIAHSRALAQLEDKPVRVVAYPRERDLVAYIFERLNMNLRTLSLNLLHISSDRELQLAVEYLTQFVQRREFVQMLMPLTVH